MIKEEEDLDLHEETTTRVGKSHISTKERVDGSLIMDESRIREAEQKAADSVNQVFQMFPSIAKSKDSDVTVEQLLFGKQATKTDSKKKR